MELSKMKSNLKMNDLYFSSCSVERACKVENGECKADLQRDITKTEEHEYDVELKLLVQKADLSVLLLQERILNLKLIHMRWKRR